MSPNVHRDDKRQFKVWLTLEEIAALRALAAERGTEGVAALLRQFIKASKNKNEKGEPHEGK